LFGDYDLTVRWHLSLTYLAAELFGTPVTAYGALKGGGDLGAGLWCLVVFVAVLITERNVCP
jgi:hypothetical protein